MPKRDMSKEKNPCVEVGDTVVCLEAGGEDCWYCRLLCQWQWLTNYLPRGAATSSNTNPLVYYIGILYLVLACDEWS